MSPRRLPGRAASIAASSASSVARMIRWSSSAGVPTMTVRAESATQPSMLTAMSALSTSPSRST